MAFCARTGQGFFKHVRADQELTISQKFVGRASKFGFEEIFVRTVSQTVLALPNTYAVDKIAFT